MKIKLLNFIYVIVGTFLIALSFQMFFAPFRIAPGGVTGLALIIESVFKIQSWITIIIADIILLIWAYLVLGKDFTIKTLTGTILLPIFISLIPVKGLTEDVLLNLIIGSLLSGAGIAILYHGNGSTGGTSIPPLIFKKQFGLNISTGIILTDGIVVIISFFSFGIVSFLYAVVAIFLVGMAADYVVTGLKRSKAVYIITYEEEKVQNFILHELKRGCTLINATGAFTKDDKKIILVCLPMGDLQFLKSSILEIDPNSFTMVHNIAEIHGEGFES